MSNPPWGSGPFFTSGVIQWRPFPLLTFTSWRFTIPFQLGTCTIYPAFRTPIFPSVLLSLRWRELRLPPPIDGRALCFSYGQLTSQSFSASSPLFCCVSLAEDTGSRQVVPHYYVTIEIPRLVFSLCGTGLLKAPFAQLNSLFFHPPLLGLDFSCSTPTHLDFFCSLS